MRQYKTKLMGKKEVKELGKKRAVLVRAAINKGHLIKSEILNATGLTMLQLNNLFQDNTELYAEYTVLRRTITDIAADNIVSIVMDKEHPKNYQASLEVMKTFKTDLDDTLDAKESSVSIDMPLGGKVKDPVTIVFSSGKK